MLGELTPAQSALFREMGHSEKFGKLLLNRGIDNREKINDFFNVAPTRLHDPFLLRGMREATDRITTAITKRERILIIGDYDCDGIVATAIMYKYLISRRASVRYFLPNRDADGYGLTIDLIDRLNTRFKPALIITVDCGISCPDEIAHAKSLGIDCIVTDHHAIPDITPDCICVNPKFTDQEYPFNELCGAGVALKLVQGLAGGGKRGIDEALKYVDICTLATVADIVALRDENRAIVTLGLERLNRGSNPAVAALAKSCNVYGPLRASDISFKLGPKINASGRMGNAKRGIDLLLEKDEIKIAEIIKSLGEMNVERQKLCTDIHEEAEQIIEQNNLAKNNIIIVARAEWEGGVLGIVAARLTDKYSKPAIVLSKAENIWKGSARSVNGINIVRLFTKFSDYLSSFGGHSLAGGLSVPVDKFDEFVERVTKYMNTWTRDDDDAAVMYDFDLDPADITLDFVREIEKLEPTGCENPPPMFLTNITTTSVMALSNFPSHIRIRAGNMNLMFFDGAALTEMLTSDMPKKLVFEFQKQDQTQKGKDTQTIKAMVKGFVPVPVTDRDYAMTLIAALRGDASYRDEKLDKIINELVVDRETFVEYYKLIRQWHGKRVVGIYDLYKRACENNSGINPFQFVFCAVVFAQLGILRLDNGYVKMDERKRTELEKSSAYLSVTGD
ncbi:MAG: single-stranded-DNA-specific exonuclease RecJ [Firmicutes bacterium]|nr:single-stranded-DNA-specific exonuclease RecJ [Bacillota bacterium]